MVQNKDRLGEPTLLFFFFLRGSHLVGREHPVVEVAREGLIDVIADAQHGTETASEHMHRQRGAPA